MASIFTKIINGDLPANFVWRDEQAVAFMSINPTAPGHTLVVPTAEVDHWIELPPASNAHLIQIAQHIGKAQQARLGANRVGIMIAGFEVPHTHIHVIPLSSMAAFDFSNAAREIEQETLAMQADLIREGLAAAGHCEASE